MTKEILGDACAFIKGINGQPNRYPRIGIAMKDGDRISVKLDSIPIDKAWEGWINIFPRDANTSGLTNNNPRATASAAQLDALRKRHNIPEFDDDDIPF